jgi:threonine/homoserine/homoserine lactone efflux protein
VDGHFLLPGLLIGVSIAAPLGPVGILCIRRTLARGWCSGMVSGLGAATADGLYAVIAAGGLTVIADLLVGHLLLLRIAGGLFLVYLGIRAFTAPATGDPAHAEKGGLLQDYATTFFFTLTNPVTILSFAGVFAAMGPGAAGGAYAAPLLLVPGVIAGSVLWWVILSSGTAALGSKCTTHTLQLVNRIAGVVIVLFGLFAIAGLFR